MASTFSILSIILIIYGIYRWRHPRPPAVQLRWKGQHVIITGGSSGLGLALAKYAAAQGANITLIARDPDRLQDAKESCKSISTEITPLVQTFSRDVARHGDIASIIQHACVAYGPPQLCVLLCRIVCSRNVYQGQARKS